jgi:hypothetical protein
MLLSDLLKAHLPRTVTKPQPARNAMRNSSMNARRFPHGPASPSGARVRTAHIHCLERFHRNCYRTRIIKWFFLRKNHANDLRSCKDLR